MTNEDHSKATFLLQAKKYKEGLKFIKELLATDSEDDILYAFLALFHQGLLNIQEAEKAITHAIKLNPDEFIHFKNAAKIYLISEKPEKSR